MSVTGSGPEPIIFPLLGPLRSGTGAHRNAGGVGPFRPWLKTAPANGAYLYPDAFWLPKLPQPIVFALRQKLHVMMRPRTKPLPARGVTITGVSRDSAGAALGGCTCTLFRVTESPPPGTGRGTELFTQVAQMVSDGSGNYSFVVGFDGPYRVTFDLAGAPIRAGLTLKSLTGI